MWGGGVAIRTPKFAGEIQQGQSLGGKLDGTI